MKYNNKEIACERNTKFLDKNYVLDDCVCGFADKKIALHIHIFYVDMLDMFINYLKDIPFDFDLLISTNINNHKIKILKMLNKTNCPKLNNVLIKIVPNVGRDVAPLLVGFRQEQTQYDFVCHIHTKKTPHNPSTSGWCNYLLRNLISKTAIKNIIGNFLRDKRIGMIFPPVYRGAFRGILDLANSDRNNMRNLLDRMKIDFAPNNTNFIFSAGTMFWYRPDALKSLFELNLTYDDFPKEPIGNTGTIAHAIERLFGIVPQYSGYKVKCYITRQELIDSYFNTYESHSKIHLQVTLFGLPLFKIRKRKLMRIYKYMPIKLKKLN